MATATTLITAMVLAFGTASSAAADDDRPAPSRQTPSIATVVDQTVGDLIDRFAAPGALHALASTLVVYDEHVDAAGDTIKSPELLGAAMGVLGDDPATSADESGILVFSAQTDMVTLDGDWAVVALDTNGDLQDDLRLVTPDLYMAQGEFYSVYVERWDGTAWADTTTVAVWRRESDGYSAGFDWRSLGLTTVRFAFGLVDEYVTNWDWAPDDYTGSLITLPAAVPLQRAPSAPQQVSAVPGDASATVSWSPPADPGTAPVTGYVVTAYPDLASCTTAVTSCTVTGLVNQRGYSFSVVAVSPAGRSAATVSSPVVPQPFTSVIVRAKKSRGVLAVDVNPNLPKKRYWTFQVHQLAPDGSWIAKKSYRTSGAKETRSLNLKKGTYRVVVQPGYGYQASMSATVTLRK